MIDYNNYLRRECSDQQGKEMLTDRLTEKKNVLQVEHE